MTETSDQAASERESSRLKEVQELLQAFALVMGLASVVPLFIYVIGVVAYSGTKQQAITTGLWVALTAGFGLALVSLAGAEAISYSRGGGE